MFYASKYLLSKITSFLNGPHVQRNYIKTIPEDPVFSTGVVYFTSVNYNYWKSNKDFKSKSVPLL